MPGLYDIGCAFAEWIGNWGDITGDKESDDALNEFKSAIAGVKYHANIH